MEITLAEIKDLTEAIRGLTAALSAANIAPQARPDTVPSTPVTTPATSNAAMPTAPAAVPVQQPQPVAAVPTSPGPAYTLEQLSLAARQLADAGRMPEVQQLVAQFGAQTMVQVPVDRYGEFATALREKGARI